MKFAASTLVILIVLPAIVLGKDKGGKNKMDKDSKYKNNKDKNEKKSFFAGVLGSFKTVLDILKTGDADELAQSACDGVFSGLGIADSMDCVCEAELIHGFSNMVADIDCVTTAQSCVSSDVTDFCGGVALTASVGGGADKQLNGNFTTCLAASMPEDLGDVSLCVSAMSDASTPGVGFDSCTASMNFMACDCTPCGDAGTDFAFTFDCTMVDLSPFKGIPIYGPKIDTCQLLNFQYTV